MMKWLLLLNLLRCCYCTIENQCNENQKLVNVISGIKRTSCTNGDVTNCPTLQIALQQKNLNNTCIQIVNSTLEVLSKNFTFYNIENLTIVNTQEHVTVNCSGDVTKTNQTTNIGLAFYWSSNIKIVSTKNTSKFEFYGCGMIQSSWTPPPPGMKKPMLVTTFYFENVNNVFFSTLLLQSYHGYGIVLHDTGGNIGISNSLFSQNFVINVEPYIGVDGYRSGGGIYIRYSGNDNYSHKNVIRLQQCKFISLTSELNRPKKEDDTDKNPYNAFGRGAAFSTFFQSTSSNNTIFINECDFANDAALWGGAVYLRFSDNSTKNNIRLRGNQFRNNSAKYAGGAVLISGSMGLHYNSINHVEILKANFTKNHGQYGGALSTWRKNVNNMNDEKVTIEDSNFSENSGKVGSAVYFITSSISMNNVLFSCNDEITKWDSQGAIGLYMSKMSLSGQVNVSNSGNTAIFLHHSKIFVHGNLNIYNNIGTYGGAMLILGHSKVFLINGSVVNFKNNYATSKGGGLYVDSPGPPIHRSYSDKSNCFFDFLKQINISVTVIFENNMANGERNDIYASTLQACKTKSGRHIWNDDKFNSSIHFSSGIFINTDPLYIKSNLKEWNNLSPGVYYQKTLYLIDELGRIVNGEIKVDVVNNEYNKNLTKIDLKNRKRFYLVTGKQGINIAFVGKKNEPFELTLSVPSTAAQTVHYKNLTLTHCPFFFYLDKNQCICSNATDMVKLGVSQCFSNQVYLFIGRWTPELEHGREKITKTSYLCPYQYCRQCHGNDSLTGKDCKYDYKNQCNYGRNQSSRLCSTCLDNFTVSISNNTCHPCLETEGVYVRNAIFVGLFMIAVDTFITLIIIYCDMFVYASYFIPLIYFYKFSNYFIKNSFFTKYEATVGMSILQFFQGSYKATLIISTCIIPNLNNLEKLYIYLVSSFSWIIAFPLCFMVISFRFKVTREVYYRTLKVISFICMSELLFFSFETLKYIEIGGDRYVYVYAEERYGKGKHLPLMFFAGVIIVLIGVHIAIEMFFALVPATKKLAVYLKSDNIYYYVYGNLKSIKDSGCNWYKRFSIASKYGLECDPKENRDNDDMLISIGVDHTWFRFMHTLFLIIFMLFAVFYYDYERNTMLTLVCLIFMAIFAMTMPYRDNFSNVFEVVVLGNMIIIGVIADSLDGIYYNYEIYETIIMVLLCFPPIVLILRAVYLFLRTRPFVMLVYEIFVTGTIARNSGTIPPPTAIKES